MKGFRDFLLRGNVVDLAIAVVIGTAFVALVAAFTKAFITPLIGLLGVKGSFENAKFTVNGSDFLYGTFVDAVIAFVILAAIVYFFVVIPVQRLMERVSKPAAGPITRPCPECLSDIPLPARRCAFCTAEVTPQA